MNSHKRRLVLNWVRQYPGITLNQLSTDIRLGFDSLRHHLLILERCGEVVRAQFGKDATFYHRTMHEPTAKALCVARHYRAFRILSHVVAAPGITHNELARRLGMQANVMGPALRRLIAVDLVFKKGEYAKRRFLLGPAFTLEFLMWLQDDWRYFAVATDWIEAGLATNSKPDRDRMPWRPDFSGMDWD